MIYLWAQGLFAEIYHKSMFFIEIDILWNTFGTIWINRLAEQNNTNSKLRYRGTKFS